MSAFFRVTGIDFPIDSTCATEAMDKAIRYAGAQAQTLRRNVKVFQFEGRCFYTQWWKEKHQ